MALFRQGALLALINPPKTLLFNAAFLPQFAQAEAGGASSLLTAAALYLVVLMLGDLLWAALAHHARPPVLLRLGRLRHRLTAVLFAGGAGIGLALARVDR